MSQPGHVTAEVQALVRDGLLTQQNQRKRVMLNPASLTHWRSFCFTSCR